MASNASPTDTHGEKTGPDQLAPDETDRVLRAVIGEVLGLSPARVADLDADSGLFGHLPELDSMAVAGLLTEIEDRLDIVIEDDEVDADMLETFGALLAFVLAKRKAASQLSA